MAEIKKRHKNYFAVWNSSYETADMRKTHKNISFLLWNLIFLMSYLFRKHLVSSVTSLLWEKRRNGSRDGSRRIGSALHALVATQMLDALSKTFGDDQLFKNSIKNVIILPFQFNFNYLLKYLW